MFQQARLLEEIRGLFDSKKEADYNQFIVINQLKQIQDCLELNAGSDLSCRSPKMKKERSIQQNINTEPAESRSGNVVNSDYNNTFYNDDVTVKTEKLESFFKQPRKKPQRNKRVDQHLLQDSAVRVSRSGRVTKQTRPYF